MSPFHNLARWLRGCGGFVVRCPWQDARPEGGRRRGEGESGQQVAGSRQSERA